MAVSLAWSSASSSPMRSLITLLAERSFLSIAFMRRSLRYKRPRWLKVDTWSSVILHSLMAFEWPLPLVAYL